MKLMGYCFVSMGVVVVVVVVGVVLVVSVCASDTVDIYAPFGLRSFPPWTVRGSDIGGLSLELKPSDKEPGKGVPILVGGRLQAGITYSAAFGTLDVSTNGFPLAFRISDWQTRLGGSTSVVLQATVRQYLLGENREVIGYIKPGVYQARGTVSAFPSGDSVKMYVCVWTTDWPIVELRSKLVYYTEKHRMRDDDFVVYDKLPADENIIMNERVTILWHLDADWLTRLLHVAAENAPDDPRWARYRDMKDAPARMSAVWDHVIGKPPLCETVIRKGPVSDSYEVTSTRASAEGFPIIFDSENGAKIVFGPWWESKKTYPSVIDMRRGELGSESRDIKAVENE